MRFGREIKMVGLGTATVLAIATGCARDSEASPAHETARTANVAAGSHVDGKNFKLDMAPAGDCKAGTACQVTVKLEALGEYHINKDYPYKLKVADAAGVELLGTDAGGKNIFSKSAGDFKIDGEKVATMTVKFKPAKAGSVTLSGTYKMSVCSAANCQLETQELSIAVTAK